jgi:hypothetical protein
MEKDQIIPEEIGGAKILEYLILTQENSSTGHTIHLDANGEIREFYALAICQYDNDDGFYLFYCNEDWKEKTDTYHSTITEAKEQAAAEFSHVTANWSKK